MNFWLWCCFVLLLAILPCGWLSLLKEDPMDRLVGLEAASVIEVLILMLLAQGTNRVPFYDLALAMAILAFGGGLVFVRFLERWAR